VTACSAMGAKRKSVSTPASPLEIFHEKNGLAFQGGGAERISKQHAQNKLTARERISFLLDEHSFEEIDRFGHALYRDEPLLHAAQQVLGRRELCVVVPVKLSERRVPEDVFVAVGDDLGREYVRVEIDDHSGILALR